MKTLCSWDTDHGAGGVYQPQMKTTLLVDNEVREHGRRYYITPADNAASRTWITDGEALRIMSDRTLELEQAATANEIINEILKEERAEGGYKAQMAWGKAQQLDDSSEFHPNASDARWWRRRRQAIARLRVFAKRLARKHLLDGGFPMNILSS